MDNGHDTIRSHVRMRLAFWQAQDRRSITTGPSWLWRGQCSAPLRQADLSNTTADIIAGRRHAGMAHTVLYEPPGPRQHRLPRWATAARAMGWLAASLGLALLAVVGAAQGTSEGDLRAVGAAGWAALGCGTTATAIAAAVLWGRRDPLRLNASHLHDIASARRTLDWNPLAGAGNVSAPAAYLLEGITVCGALQASTAWQLPGADALHRRLDADEEVFQIARATYWMDRLEGRDAAIVVDRQGDCAAVEGRGGAQEAERDRLAGALLDRLVVLHGVLVTLGALQQRAFDLRCPDVGDLTVDDAVFSAQVENEMAANLLAQLNTDMLAVVDGYDTVSAWNRPIR